MTLVIAQKIESLIFLYADTFSINDYTRESVNWFQQPMKKIFPLNDRFVFGFSGNPYYMIKLIRDMQNNKPKTIEQVKELWGENQEIDLIVADAIDHELYRMSDRGVECINACYVGSPTGFEAYQRFRHEGIPQDYANFSVVRMPEGATPNGHEVFGHAHQAFQAVMFETDGTFGGIPISYVMTPQEQRFGTHCAVYRGPLKEEELAPGRWTSMGFRDAVEGQFIASVWGSQAISAIYFPNARLGFLGSNDRENPTEYARHAQIDGYDFTYESEQYGAGAGISTWDSWQNSFHKVQQYVREGNQKKAHYALKKLHGQITHQIKAWNEDFDENNENFHESISECGNVTINISMVNAISAYYVSKIEFSKRFEGAISRDLSLQKNAWDTMVADLRFQVSAGGFRQERERS